MVALIIANGMFAGAEIAIVSIRRTRVDRLVEAKRRGAQALAALRAAPETFLATIQVGITVVGTTAAAFGGSTMSGHLAPLIARVPIDAVAERADSIALAVIVAFVSYLSLVLGELVPKSLALRAAEPVAMVVSQPVLALSFFAKPIVWLLTASSNLVLRPFRDRTNFMESRISKEELQQMVEEAGVAGAVNEQTSELAWHALEFDKLTLGQVMIPRLRIDALPIDASPETVRTFMLEQRRSRIPLYEGTLDNVLGYVSAKDIVALAWEGRLIVLRDLMRPVKIFPETVLALEVLRFMRRERQRLAVAVDEHGAVSGIVTFEDLVEEIVGEAYSEHEDDVMPIVREGATTLVRGDTAIRDVNRELAIELDQPPGVTTISGLCTHLAGGIPNRGARLAANGGVVIEVVDATSRTVRRVRLVMPPD